MFNMLFLDLHILRFSLNNGTSVGLVTKTSSHNTQRISHHLAGAKMQIKPKNHMKLYTIWIRNLKSLEKKTVCSLAEWLAGRLCWPRCFPIYLPLTKIERYSNVYVRCLVLKWCARWLDRVSGYRFHWQIVLWKLYQWFREACRKRFM